MSLNTINTSDEAMQKMSSGRCQRSPLTYVSTATERSMSVNSYASTLPARANTPSSEDSG